MTVKHYTDLIVWQRSMDLVKATYKVTSALPDAERYALVSQMRRSAVSIPSNIAEGFGRRVTGDYRRHLSIARGSLHELETQFFVCRELGFAEPEVISSLTKETEEISRMLASLISKMR